MDGLSVAPSHGDAKLTISRGDGVAALNIEAIVSLRLQLVQHDEHHGCITGLPYPDENYDLAMDLADRLLNIADVTREYWKRD